MTPSAQLLSLLSGEHALLCELARQDVDQRRVIGMIEEVAPIQWDKFGEIAFEHKLLPLVRRNVKEYVPLNSQPSEIQIHEWNARLAPLDRIVHLLQSFMQDIVAAFRESNIEYVIWKGPAFAEMVYGVPTWRQYYDLDLLVQPENVMDAHDILLRIGFVPEPHGADVEVTREQVAERVYVQNHQFPYIHADGPCYVEIHTGVTNQSNIRLPDVQIKESKLYGGIHFPALIDLHLIACLHAYQHIPYNVPLLQDKSSKLGHYTDIRESYLKIAKRNEIKFLQHRANEWNCSDVMTTMIHEAERLFGDFSQKMKMTDESKPKIWAVNWESDHIDSSAERRIFDPISEYEEIKRKHQLLENNNDDFNRLACVFVPKSRTLDGLRSAWDNQQNRVLRSNVDKMFFWPSHSSARRDLSPPLDVPEFMVLWDCEHLTIMAEVVDNGIQESNVMEFRDRAVYLFTRVVHEGGRSDFYVPCQSSVSRDVLSPTSTIPQLPQLKRISGAHAFDLRSKPLIMAIQVAWTTFGIEPRYGLSVRFDIGIFLSNYLSAFLMYSGCAFEYGFLFERSPSYWAHARMTLTKGDGG